MFFKREEGFTSLELIMALAVTTLTAVVFFILISDTVKISRMTKESHYSEELISTYVQYYEDVEITSQNIHNFFSGTGRVDLVSNVKRFADPEDFPENFKNLIVMCENTPKISEDNNFIQFKIECTINDRPINRGSPFIVKRFVE